MSSLKECRSIEASFDSRIVPFLLPTANYLTGSCLLISNAAGDPKALYLFNNEIRAKHGTLSAVHDMNNIEHDSPGHHSSHLNGY